MLLAITSTYAELHIVVSNGQRAAMPIAIVPFAGQQNDLSSPNNIAGIIKHDLDSTGHFKSMPFVNMQQQPTVVKNIRYNYWLENNYDYMVLGSVKTDGSNAVTVSFSLVNIILGKNQRNPVVLSNTFTIPKSQLREAAHKISDRVYQQLTGIRGVFSTRIAYVLIKRPAGSLPEYYLKIADADGYNPRSLVQSNEPLMSPAWSSTGREIAYVSLANDKASIYVVNVATGKQWLVSDFPGINGAPDWSPEGDQLAIVLSKTGHPKIYTYDLVSSKLTQITHGYSIDTEPNYAPDGKSLIFTSNLGGNPQIYRLNLATHQISRITFTGDYNARPTFTSNGKNIVLLHRDAQGFNIAIQNLASGAMKILTRNGYDSTPSVAPNGQMIVYSNDAGINGALEIVSADGLVNYKLPVPAGTVLEPAWSPYTG
jgi:TolB protein